jgi:hypothetical protein
MPSGRPTDYTEDLADLICERLAIGESMRSIARDEDMPAMSTLFKWLRVHPSFTEQYERAKVESADAMSEDCIDIADNIDGQTVMVDGVPLVVEGEMVKVVDSVSVQHAKLKVDTRKWLMSKMKPKKYGERTTTEHTGSLKVSDLSESELDSKLLQLEQLLEQSAKT